MALGSEHSCFASTSGSLVCFGINVYGQVRIYRVVVYFWYSMVFSLSQLGYEDTAARGGCDSGYELSSLTPIDLGASFRVAQVTSCAHHTCALSTSDELKCWGKSSVSVYDVHIIRVLLSVNDPHSVLLMCEQGSITTVN